MEVEDSISFYPDILYGDKFELFQKFLNTDSSDLIGDALSEFKNLIHFHMLDNLKYERCKLPSFSLEDLEWLNTTRSLSYEKDLKNKICVLDFFTYCCINCIHILPYLKAVEEEHINNPAFTVIGVHSPKFPREKCLENLKKAIFRNNITHPVINDPECKLWKTFGIYCWPTIFIVGPDHRLLFILVGEKQIEKLSFLCSNIVTFFESKSTSLDRQPLPILKLNESESEEMLFPGKISSNGDEIIVSTGCNQLLLLSRFFKVKERIGSGLKGCDDGPFNTASFNSPQGTAFFKDYIYVADTGNHSIRKIDLKKKYVTTVFDSQRNVKAVKPYPENSSPKFLSPWDVCIGPRIDSDFKEMNVLYIAVAGSHQIWELNLETEDLSSSTLCVPFAGSGTEENRPNKYRFKAGFAQPSGIEYSKVIPDYLFVADSESSTIKSISLKGGAVETIIGGGRDPTDLFQFGDQDGHHLNVKLQHPMSDCVLNKDMLAIADTYNNKIKIVNIEKRICKTLYTDKLNEPSGICVFDNKLLVADTNNHCIVPIPTDSVYEVIPTTYDVHLDTINLHPKEIPETKVLLCTDGKIFCNFTFLSSEFILNEDGSQKWDISFKGFATLDAVAMNEKLFGKFQPSLILKSNLKKHMYFDETPPLEVTLAVTLPLCEEKLNLCHVKTAFFKLIVEFSDSGAKTIWMNFKLNNSSKLFL